MSVEIALFIVHSFFAAVFSGHLFVHLEVLCTVLQSILQGSWHYHVVKTRR